MLKGMTARKFLKSYKVAHFFIYTKQAQKNSSGIRITSSWHVFVIVILKKIEKLFPLLQRYKPLTYVFVIVILKKFKQ